MGTIVAFRRFVEIRERHRARAVARRVAEPLVPAAGAPEIEGDLVPPPVTSPAGRAGRLPLGRRGPAFAASRRSTGD